MNYLRPYAPPLDVTIVAAWDFQIAETPWLAQSAAAQSADLFPRFATCYAQLRALPRGARRALQRRLASSQDLAAIPPEWRQKLARSVAGAALLLALGQGVAQAATITVNTNIPKILADGKCSLVEAIINANNDALTHPDCAAGSGADTIVLPAASVHTVLNDYDFTYGATRLPAITSQITIEGNGSKITRKKSKVQSRLMAVTTTGDLTLKNVTLSGGQHSYGGALFNYGGLMINESTITGNSAVTGGAVANGAGAGLVIEDSLFSKNTAVTGGGIFNYKGDVTVRNSSLTGHKTIFSGGGLYDVSGTVTIESVIIDGNKAGAGGAIYAKGSLLDVNSSMISGNSAGSHGGGIWIASTLGGSATVTIANSTVAGNKAHYSSAGILHQNFGGTLTIQNSAVLGNTASAGGGGIEQTSGTMTIENSTISGNRGGSEGAGIWNQNTATIRNSTISGNTSKRSGGVRNSGQLTLDRNLISGNKAAVGREIYSYTSGTVVADNFNLFGNNGSAGVVGFLPGATDIVPGAGVLISNILAPLANNGGPTQTHALVAGSPAIDASPADADCPSTDQRGTLRPQGPLCDIGAFEK
ncbi:MAG TPA: right-handed parallel beta-helix repeat-containing protein [Candidatus Binatia bacterium]